MLRNIGGILGNKFTAFWGLRPHENSSTVAVTLCLVGEKGDLIANLVDITYDGRFILCPISKEVAEYYGITRKDGHIAPFYIKNEIEDE